MKTQKVDTIKRRARRPWKERFLSALRLTGNVRAASAAAGVTRSTAYGQRETDQAFRQAFDDAREEAADRLEQEAFRRAHDGTRRPIGVNGKTHFIREYSDTLLIFLLKAARPQRYRDNHRVEVDHRVEVSDAEIKARRRQTEILEKDPEAVDLLIELSRKLYPADGTERPAPTVTDATTPSVNG